MEINGIHLDPVVNPAVLDTLTWDPAAAKAALDKSDATLKALAGVTRVAGLTGDKLADQITHAVSPADHLSIATPSIVSKDGAAFMLAVLNDGQKVILSVREAGSDLDLKKLWEREFDVADGGELTVAAHPMDMHTVKEFVTRTIGKFGPVDLGATPRLGVGNRQSTMVWPGIFEALRNTGITAEIIQNSAWRELAPVSFILSPPASEVTYLPGHGSLNIGHTGSSIQGLWLAGVAAAIEAGFDMPYGADLDHIPVKSADAEGLERAKALIEAGQYFTFFTLDTSALFNLDALKLEGDELETAFEAAVPEEWREDLLASYEERPDNINAEYWPSDDTLVKQLGAAYWASIEAAAEMYGHIIALKHGEGFDFEFSLDEGPEITEPVEQTFVLNELKKRGVTVTFIAPNVGFEKRVDYRKPDGLPGLAERVAKMNEIGRAYGAMLDFHSGSDKAPETYQTIAKAGDGVKLKVSGKLQLIFSEVLADVEPGFFNEWWDWTLGSARAEAERGSDVAKKYVGIVEERMAAEGASFKKSPKDLFFTDFSFGMVGAKDEKGQFMFRDRFYTVSKEVQEEYTKRTVAYLEKLAQDLLLV